MANEPSLSEFTNMRVDPELGSGTPAVLINTADNVRNLNEAARFQAENSWKRYNLFLGNLKDLMSDAKEVAQMPIASQDYEDIKSEFGTVMQEISKDPKQLFGNGGNFLQIQARLNQLTQKAVQSKQDRILDEAHRSFMGRQPELDTPENKQALENFWNAPLGKRKPYVLQMPVIFDLSSYTKGIFADPAVKQKFSNANVTPDGHIKIESGDRYSYQAYKDRFKAGINYQDDKYGHSIKTWVQQQYDQLPPEQKKKVGSVENYWDSIADATFVSDSDESGNKKDIININKTEEKADPMAITRQKSADKLYQMQVKFGYDKVLKAMGAGERITVEQWKLDHGVGTAGNQQKSGMVLNDLTVSILKDAQANGKPLAVYDAATDTWKKAYEANTSMGLGNMFATENVVNGKKTKRHPDQILVDEDNVTHVNFFDLDSKGKPKMNGDKAKLDASLSKTITPDDLKSQIAIEHKLDKSLEASNEYLLEHFKSPSLNGNVDGYIEARTSGYGDVKDKKPESGSHTSVTYSFNGKKFKYEDVKKAAKTLGLSVDEYAKKYKLNKD